MYSTNYTNVNSGEIIFFQYAQIRTFCRLFTIIDYSGIQFIMILSAWISSIKYLFIPFVQTEVLHVLQFNLLTCHNIDWQIQIKASFEVPIRSYSTFRNFVHFKTSPKDYEIEQQSKATRQIQTWPTCKTRNHKARVTETILCYENVFFFLFL